MGVLAIASLTTNLLQPLGRCSARGFDLCPPIQTKNLLEETLLIGHLLIIEIKILSTFADVFNRRNIMVIEYIIVCLTLVYIGAVIIIYRKSKRSRSDG